MSDFINQLRNGNPKRFDRDRNRKPFEGPAFRNPDRSQHRDRDRKSGAPPPRRSPEIDLAPLVRALEGFTVEAQRLAEAAEARMRLEPRWLAAMESIAANLERIASSRSQARTSASIAAEAIALESTPVLPVADAREAIVERIRSLRAEGLSYEKIALQLDSEGFATVSGRGKWRGPAVQRLLGLDGAAA